MNPRTEYWSYFINAWKPLVQLFRSLSLKGSKVSVWYLVGLETSLDDSLEGLLKVSIGERKILRHDPSSMRI